MSYDSYGSPTQDTRYVKVIHLVFGVIYLGIVAVWALGTSGTVDWGDSVRYLAPIVLVVAGGIGLAAALLPGVRRRRTDNPLDDNDHPFTDNEGNLR
jgi:hypothetical protein